MTKKHITILIVLICVLALAIVAAILLLTVKDEEPQEGSLLVSEVNFNTVLSMSITDENNSLTLELKENEWYIENTDVKVDQVKASSMSTHLCYVYANKIIESDDVDLFELGLAPAKLTAQIKTIDGVIHTFYYGIQTTDKTSVYLKIQGDDKIYTVLNDHFKQLVSNVSNLQDLNAPHIEKGLLTQISFKGTKQEINFTKREQDLHASSWKIEQPIIAPVMMYVIDTISQTVSGLRLEEYLGLEYKAEYGISNISSWFECTDSDGNTLKITFGNDMNEYYTYCQVEGKEGYYLIDKQKFQFIEFAASDFINTQLISGQQPIVGLTLTGDTLSISLNNTGNEYIFNGNRITQDDYDLIIESIKSINTGGVVDTHIEDEPKYEIALLLSESPFNATIKLYEYRNSFYAVDYGDGAYIYISGSEFDALVSALTAL